MPKQESRRLTKPSNGSPGRRRSNSPAPGYHPEEVPEALVMSHEDVATRAYALYLARGGQPGDDLRDWFQAEADLRRELVAS